MNDLKLKIKFLYAKIFAIANIPTKPGQKLFQYAKEIIGKDASPKDLASDEYGCAESVSTILADLFPPFQIITGTYLLYMALKSAEFIQISLPLPGDVIISPTGLGGSNGIHNGHVGIVGENNLIMSNNSATGLWDVHYTLDSWRQRYQVLGGYPVYYFRRII